MSSETVVETPQVPETPAQTAPPETPSKPARPSYLLQMAEDAEIPHDEIDRLDDNALGFAIAQVQRARAAFAREKEQLLQQMQAGQPAQKQSPAEAFDFGTDAEGNKITFDTFHPGIQKFMKKTLEETAELRAQLAQAQEVVRQSAATGVHARIDNFFSSHKSGIFGKGAIGAVAEDERRRRQAVVDAAKSDTSKRSMEEKLESAASMLAGLFGGAQRKSETATSVQDPELAQRAQAWAQGGLSRPTHRQGGSEPSGEAKAVAALETYLRQFGSQAAGETTLAGFPK